ncbi:MAG: hypothetical protein J0I23_28910 [Rhizobiales bacterium]|nr:hypothetical protein [Hyphomicrobiales bacterium]
MTTVQLDLDKLAGSGKVKNLSGKERGIAARAELHLDELDRDDNTVEVLVPDYVDAISPSYFQGLFSGSIQRLEGKKAFLEKYKFIANSRVLRWIDIGIRNATSSREDLI